MRVAFQLVLLGGSILHLAAQNGRAPAYLSDDSPFFSEAGVRIASNFPSIQAAVDSLPVTGGTVILPVGSYTVTKCIDSGLKRVVLQGRGWRTTSPQASFGEARWLTSVTGSVLKVAGPSGICLSTDHASHLVFRDLAIVGTGVQGSVGIDVTASVTYLHQFHNVMIANFSVGMRLKNILDSDFTGMQLFGNETGIVLSEVANEITLISPRFEGNGIAMVVNGGLGVHCIGGLVQANGAGFLFSPDQAPMTHASSFEGLWFEANAGYDLRFDSSLFPVGAMTFRSNRHSGNGRLIQFTGTHSTNRIYFENLEAGGIDLTIPPTSSNTKVDSSNFASITDNGQLTLILNDPIGARNKLTLASLTSNELINARGGLSLATAATKPACSVANRGMLWVSRGSVAVADIFSVCLKTASGTFEWKDFN